MDSLSSHPTDIPPVIFPNIPLVQVTDEELSQFAELIYKRTGIRVTPQKKNLLSNRLRRRLRETGMADFSAYYRLLLLPMKPICSATRTIGSGSAAV